MESLYKLWRELEYAFEMQYPVDVVENIINKNPMVLEHRFGSSEITPLRLAVVSRNAAEILNVIELLVRRGKKALKMTNKHGNIPLHYACRNGNSSLEVIQLLINYFPDSIRVKDHCKRTPLHSAVFYNLKFDIIKFLFDLYPEAAVERNIFGRTSLHDECISSTPRQEVIELLLSPNSESIRVPDNYGFTPLSLLCRDSKSFSRDTIQIVYEACPETARKKVGSYSNMSLNAFHLACKAYNDHCTLTAVQFFCERDPCLFITVHDETSIPWDTFYDSLKESFEGINNNTQVYKCVRHAAVSLVRKLVHREQKPLSHMEADTAEHLVELLERKPFPTLQEVSTPNVREDAFTEYDIFQELQTMLCSKRFQTFLKACPIVLEARRDPESKAKAVVALSSSVCKNHPDLLFHQLRKNPFIVDRSFVNNNQKKKRELLAIQFGSNEESNQTKRQRR